MKWTSGTKKLVAVGCALAATLVVTACDDDDKPDSDPNPTSPDPSALPTGPVPDGEVTSQDTPEVQRGSTLRVGNTVWSFNQISSEAENLAVSLDLRIALTARDNPDDYSTAQVYDWGAQTYIVQPGQTQPVVLSVPVSKTQLSDTFAILTGADVSEMPKYDSWAHPWSAEAIPSVSVVPTEGDLGDLYYAPWRASFNVEEPTTGQVLCYDQNDKIIGGSRGPVQVEAGATFVDVVAASGIQAPEEAREPGDPPWETVERCDLFPTRAAD